LSSLAAAINAQSAGTNITAVADDKGNLTLTNSDGADIGVENISGADTATVKSGTASDTFDSGKALGAGNATDGSNFATVGGTVAFHSSSGFTVNSTITNSSTGAALVSTSTAGTLDKVSDIDVSTTKGANDALSVIDAALQSINNSRADMGALQNRFTSTISNLQTSSENMSAARSRIQDTDFAAETANMTRNQILQQAGTAMLAQANQLPNSVMSLLR
jgi:flagellin